MKLTPMAVEALRAHLIRQLKEIDRLDSLYKDGGLVFATERGTPVVGVKVGQDWKSEAKNDQDHEYQIQNRVVGVVGKAALEDVEACVTEGAN